MTVDYIIVGSGLAAVGAAKALVDKGLRPLILDCGDTLPNDVYAVSQKLKKLDTREWEKTDLLQVTKSISQDTKAFSIPTKLVFGSDFFLGSSCKEFLVKTKDKMVPPFSRAFGGLSNGWGAASLPPSEEDIADWPVERADLLKHFERVLEDIPMSGLKDSLNLDFPSLKDDMVALQLTPQDEWLLSSLNNARSSKIGEYAFGQARLLVNADAETKDHCKYCSLCMSGCVYDAIYKANHSFKKWLTLDKVDYVSGVTVTSYEEDEDKNVAVNFRDKSGITQKISCKKLFIAAGCVPSSKIFLQSNKSNTCNLKVKTRGGYVLPVWRMKGFKDQLNKNTQPGVFIEVKGKSLKNWVHIQISSSNELLEHRLNKGFFSWPIINSLVKFSLKHLAILLVNFHSDHSGQYHIAIEQEDNENKNRTLRSEYKKNKFFSKNLIASIIQITKTLMPIGIIPLPILKMNSGTYHVGGSLPMKENPKEAFDTDTLGRPKDVMNVYFVDSSNFPSLPGTTIGILSMANAHRITTAALK